MRLSLFIPLTLALSLQGRGDKREVKAVWDAEAEVFYSYLKAILRACILRRLSFDSAQDRPWMSLKPLCWTVAPELIMVNHRT